MVRVQPESQIAIAVCKYEVRLEITEVLHSSDRLEQFSKVPVAEHRLVALQKKTRPRIASAIVVRPESRNPGAILEPPYDGLSGIRRGADFLKQTGDGFRTAHIAAPSHDD